MQHADRLSRRRNVGCVEAAMLASGVAHLYEKSSAAQHVGAAADSVVGLGRACASLRRRENGEKGGAPGGFCARAQRAEKVHAV